MKKMKQLHTESRTRSKCQSADAKAKKLSKFKKREKRKQSSCTSKKQARKKQKKKKMKQLQQVVHAANVKVPAQKEKCLASLKKGNGESNQTARARCK